MDTNICRNLSLLKSIKQEVNEVMSLRGGGRVLSMLDAHNPEAKTKFSNLFNVCLI